MEKYGPSLAKKTVEYLIKYKQIAYHHKEYCGTGFYYEDQKIYYTYFFDGFPELSRASIGELKGVIREFNDFSDFQIWLENQTDESLSGKELNKDFFINNQRITKQRLQELKE